jgi:anaerobic magnesium-protoporphyrin IX monomethyl ester cyclase
MASKNCVVDRMKFLLINVPIRLTTAPNAFPTGLAIIAQVLLDNGHDVEVIDANAERLDLGQTLDRIKASDAEAVGLSGLVSTYRYQLELTAGIKAARPDLLLISGGGCATSVPELMMAHMPVDILVLGEGEHTIRELADALSKKAKIDAVAGLMYREGDELKRTAPRKAEDDLDVFPIPAYGLFPTEIYVKNMIWREQGPSMNIISSRGCPMDCRFCYNLFGQRSYRRRSAELIIEEVRLLKEDYGVEYFAFVDDNLTVRKDHLEAVCTALAAENITWGCHGRVDTAKDDRLEIMAKSGCDWLGFGVESGSQRILDLMRKRTTTEKARGAIARTRKHGIFANSTFIYGYPGEDDESLVETMRFCIEAGVAFSPFFATPYPGTELYDQAKEAGLISDDHEFIQQLNDAGHFIVNFSDLSDEDYVARRSQAHKELVDVFHFLEVYIDFTKATSDAKKKHDLLQRARAALGAKSLLPELKGYACLALYRYFQAEGEKAQARTVIRLARKELASKKTSPLLKPLFQPTVNRPTELAVQI